MKCCLIVGYIWLATNGDTPKWMVYKFIRENDWHDPGTLRRSHLRVPQGSWWCHARPYSWKRHMLKVGQRHKKVFIYNLEPMAFVKFEAVWNAENKNREYLRWRVSGSCCQRDFVTHPKIASALILQQPFEQFPPVAQYAYNPAIKRYQTWTWEICLKLRSYWEHHLYKSGSSIAMSDSRKVKG